MSFLRKFVIECFKVSIKINGHIEYHQAILYPGLAYQRRI